MQSDPAQVSEECSLPVAARTLEDLLWLWLEMSIKRDPDFIDIRPQTQVLENPSPNETSLRRRQHAEIKSIHDILSLGRAEGVLTRVIHPRSRESRLLSDGQRKRCLRWMGAQRSCCSDRLRAVYELSAASGRLTWNVRLRRLESTQASSELRGRMLSESQPRFPLVDEIQSPYRMISYGTQSPWQLFGQILDGDHSDAGNFDCPEVVEEPNINGHLQDTDVSAFPDTGAAANFISLSYAQQHGLMIDESVRERVTIGDGSNILVIGTTNLPFSFAGELTKHYLEFQVLRKSLHDVILGSAFLRASETLTRFTHRVQRKIRKSVGHGNHRVCFLGSHQYVKGQANDILVNAIPDTGADVSVMSERFAKSKVFEIDDDEQHRISLEFVDGSTAKACGVVKDVAWRYGVDEQTHPTNVYVLPKLPTDLVLGYAFLRQTNAFVKHQHDFWHDEALGTRTTSMLGIIRMLRKAKKDWTIIWHPGKLGKGKTEGPFSDAAEKRWQSAKTKELVLYRTARHEAWVMGLSCDETARYLQPHLARYQQFMASWPDPDLDAVYTILSIPNMAPPSPDSGSVATSQIGGVQPQNQSIGGRMCLLVDALDEATEMRQLEKSGETELFRKARKEAQALGLSEDDTAQYLQPHIARWQPTRPAHSTGLMSISPSSPSSGSAASSQAGGAHVQVQSHTLPTGGTLSAGRFSMNGFKGLAYDTPD